VIWNAVKKTVYIETTIPSIYFNRRPEPEMVARCNWTREWWDERRSEYDLYTGIAVVEELRRADHPDKADKLQLLRGEDFAHEYDNTRCGSDVH
jgi:hypothetical protein